MKVTRISEAHSSSPIPPECLNNDFFLYTIAETPSIKILYILYHIRIATPTYGSFNILPAGSFFRTCSDGRAGMLQMIDMPKEPVVASVEPGHGDRLPPRTITGRERPYRVLRTDREGGNFEVGADECV
jgi:hypothetical protein